MAINKKNTDLLKDRFFEEFEIQPQVTDENEHGSDGVYIDVTGWVNFDSLRRIKDGIGNTMSIRIEADKIRIVVW
jgi:hypothetical protein